MSEWDGRAASSSIATTTAAKHWMGIAIAPPPCIVVYKVCIVNERHQVRSRACEREREGVGGEAKERERAIKRNENNNKLKSAQLPQHSTLRIWVICFIRAMFIGSIGRSLSADDTSNYSAVIIFPYNFFFILFASCCACAGHSEWVRSLKSTYKFRGGRARWKLSNNGVYANVRENDKIILINSGGGSSNTENIHIIRWNMGRRELHRSNTFSIGGPIASRTMMESKWFRSVEKKNNQVIDKIKIDKIIIIKWSTILHLQIGFGHTIREMVRRRIECRTPHNSSE